MCCAVRGPSSSPCVILIPNMIVEFLVTCNYIKKVGDVIWHPAVKVYKVIASQSPYASAIDNIKISTEEIAWGDFEANFFVNFHGKLQCTFVQYCVRIVYLVKLVYMVWERKSGFKCPSFIFVLLYVWQIICMNTIFVNVSVERAITSTFLPSSQIGTYLLYIRDIYILRR